MIQVVEAKDQKRNILTVLYEGYGKEYLHLVVTDNISNKIRLLDLQTGNLWNKEWSTLNQVLAEEGMYLAESATLVVKKY